jgi:hypothetical protein
MSYGLIQRRTVTDLHRLALQLCLYLFACNANPPLHLCSYNLCCALGVWLKPLHIKGRLVCYFVLHSSFYRLRRIVVVVVLCCLAPHPSELTLTLCRRRRHRRCVLSSTKVVTSLS